MSRSAIHALLVYPEIALSRWGFKHALRFIDKGAYMPPLGLLTVAALLPPRYRARVRDMNVEPLTDADLRWADVVFTSSMIVQQRSLQQVIARCRRARRLVVAGGPYPSACHDDIPGVDHFVLGEVEDLLPSFLADLEAGRAGPLYRAPGKPDLTRTPPPRYDLVDLNAYYYMAAQFSRGCPFTCEFCDIPALFGRVPRTKTNQQMLAELEQLYRLGWRGPVFISDDNFIANKRDAMRLLPALAAWQRQRRYPFTFLTEASVNLARIDPLLDAMVDAGFNRVFLGIETPNPAALARMKKVQNIDRRRSRRGPRAPRQRAAREDAHKRAQAGASTGGEGTYLLDAVRTIQARGIEVTAGFILGLDGDGPEVFDAQIEFAGRAGIPMAAVGLLTALRGTPLYERLGREHRLRSTAQANIDMLEIALDFEPEMDEGALLEGYRRVLTTLYDPGLASYFERCATLLRRLKPTRHQRLRIGAVELRALARSIRWQLFSRQGPAYLKFLARTARVHPTLIPKAVELAIIGYHFEKMAAGTAAAIDFRESVRRARAYLEAEPRRPENGIPGPSANGDAAREILDRLDEKRRRVPEDFAPLVQDARRWLEARRRSPR